MNLLFRRYLSSTKSSSNAQIEVLSAMFRPCKNDIAGRFRLLKEIYWTEINVAKISLFHIIERTLIQLHFNTIALNLYIQDVSPKRLPFKLVR